MTRFTRRVYWYSLLFLIVSHNIRYWYWYLLFVLSLSIIMTTLVAWLISPVGAYSDIHVCTIPVYYHDDSCVMTNVNSIPIFVIVLSPPTGHVPVLSLQAMCHDSLLVFCSPKLLLSSSMWMLTMWWPGIIARPRIRGSSFFPSQTRKMKKLRISCYI